MRSESFERAVYLLMPSNIKKKRLPDQLPKSLFKIQELIFILRNRE